MENLSVIDFIFLGLIGLFVIRCFLKGFISELLTVAAILFGVLAAVFFHNNIAEYFQENHWPEMNFTVLIVLAFVSLFITVALIITLIKLLLKGIISRANLGGSDRFLGIILGLVEGFAVVGLVLFLLRVIQRLFKIDTMPLLENSFFANLLLPLIPE